MSKSPRKGNYTTFVSATSNETPIWRYRLFGLVALLVALVAASFGQPTNIAGRVGCSTSLTAHYSDPNFISKAGHVVEILEVMSKRREHFLTTSDMVDIFPTLYFHTTRSLFGQALRDKTPTAEIILDMIIAFYDAYAANRQRFDTKGANSVEPHWRPYYKGAVKANRSRSVKVMTIAAVLLNGIDAHVAYDLPRATRWILSSSTFNISAVKAEFYKMNTVFKHAAESTHKDIIAARKVWNKFASLESISGFGASYVIHGRQLAWDLAVSEKKLPTSEPQPVLGPTIVPGAYFSVPSEVPGFQSR